MLERIRERKSISLLESASVYVCVFVSVYKPVFNVFVLVLSISISAHVRVRAHVRIPYLSLFNLSPAILGVSASNIIRAHGKGKG